MDLIDALLDSWDRQCKIVDNVATLIDENNRDVKPSEDGWPLYHQLAHIHLVRRYWLSQVSPDRAAKLGESYVDGWMTPISDLAKIKSLLGDSALQVREAMGEL